MSKKRIQWVVVLMTVGLLGLIGLQSYWVNSALQLQKEQFDYKVTDALQQVVRSLERQEMIYMSRQRLQTQQQQNRLRAIARATEAPDEQPIRVAKPSRPVQSKPQRSNLEPADRSVAQSDVLHAVGKPLSVEQMAVIESFIFQQNELMATGDWEAQLRQQQQFNEWFDRVMTGELHQLNGQLNPDSAITRPRHFQHRIDRGRRKGLKPTEPVAKTAEQSELVKDVLKGLLLSERPMEERVNRQVIDTLLRQTLNERGISLPYAFAVSTPSRKNFLFSSRGVQAKNFADNGYRATLFPNQMLDAGNYLYVYFPTRRQYLLDRMGFTFGASAVLILVILACFYVAIATIMRQKKLADIKSDFINNMTHELKTPISTISLAAEMAQQQLPKTPTDAQNPNDTSRLNRYMSIIRDETYRLGAHVEKVLQMALLDQGDIQLKLSAVNIHDVIEKTLRTLGLQIEQRGGEVELDFEAQHEIIEADELHLTNILHNLLDNALKYSPDPPHLTIATTSQPDGVSITVADRGIGMNKEQLSRIFEKFYRVPTGNRHDVKGFGLGLSYVKKMVEKHQGRIAVHSQPGQGSAFTLFLPYQQRTAAS